MPRTIRINECPYNGCNGCSTAFCAEPYLAPTLSVKAAKTAPESLYGGGG